MKCISPFTIKDEQKNQIPVPCGKCPACTARRVSHWSFRLMQEYKRSYSAYFVTITYNTDSVPITNNGFMSLCKKDVQDYFKRLRKRHQLRQRPSIKYFAAGEYGGKTKRPHYHIIMFNAHLDDIVRAWNKNTQEIGYIHIGEVTEASCGYTLKYIHKGTWRPQHKNDDREPQFQLQSKDWAATILLHK